MLVDVISVSAWETRLENPSLSTEVSPLSRLFVEPRRSVGLRKLWKFFETTLGGRGGTGSVGANPGCLVHRLVDLGNRWDCTSRAFPSAGSITQTPGSFSAAFEEARSVL